MFYKMFFDKGIIYLNDLQFNIVMYVLLKKFFQSPNSGKIRSYEFWV